MNEEQNTESRRKFLAKLSIGLGALAASAISVPVISALLHPVLKQKPQTWRRVGGVNDFKTGTTTLVRFMNSEPTPWSGETDKTAAWLRRVSENEFLAFSANCTHLGCPIRWEEEAQLFFCPCHGGVFYKNGKNAAGPPLKPLVQYQVRINGNFVEIKTAPVPITTMKA